MTPFYTKHLKIHQGHGKLSMVPICTSCKCAHFLDRTNLGSYVHLRIQVTNRRGTKVRPTREMGKFLPISYTYGHRSTSRSPSGGLSLCAAVDKKLSSSLLYCCWAYMETHRDVRRVPPVHQLWMKLNDFPDCDHCRTNQTWLGCRGLTQLVWRLADLHRLVIKLHLRTNPPCFTAGDSLDRACELSSPTTVGAV